tara:strand:- start:620 stop:1204 length:585 start_codon:yes stop_codon:yes gene_type:complete
MVPKNSKKIIMYLLKNLGKYNINQIARKTKISVGSAFKILNGFEKNEFVKVEALGNAKYFQLNLECKELIKICEFLLLEEKRNLKGYGKIYAKDIEEFEKAELIVLFGSVLKKNKFNDVDVLFVSNRVKNVSNFCLQVSKIRTKPVVPLILKKEDLVKSIKEKKKSILALVKEGVILKGESLFMEVLRDARSQI